MRTDQQIIDQTNEMARAIAPATLGFSAIISVLFMIFSVY